MTTWDICFRGLPGIGLINPGDDLATIITTAAKSDGFALADHDVVIVAQKVVSKAEDRIVDLATVTPSPRAVRLAERTGRDARLCQLYLDESKAILNVKGRHVVTVDNRGFQGTGAGVDLSNVGLVAKAGQSSYRSTPTGRPGESETDCASRRESLSPSSSPTRSAATSATVPSAQPSALPAYAMSKNPATSKTCSATPAIRS